MRRIDRAAPARILPWGAIGLLIRCIDNASYEIYACLKQPGFHPATMDAVKSKAVARLPGRMSTAAIAPTPSG